LLTLLDGLLLLLPCLGLPGLLLLLLLHPSAAALPVQLAAAALASAAAAALLVPHLSAAHCACKLLTCCSAAIVAGLYTPLPATCTCFCRCLPCLRSVPPAAAALAAASTSLLTPAAAAVPAIDPLPTAWPVIVALVLAQDVSADVTLILAHAAPFSASPIGCAASHSAACTLGVVGIELQVLPPPQVFSSGAPSRSCTPATPAPPAAAAVSPVYAVGAVGTAAEADSREACGWPTEEPGGSSPRRPRWYVKLNAASSRSRLHDAQEQAENVAVEVPMPLSTWTKEC
jgi:hypothetical protein